jgi:hypothetical protein
MKIIFHLIDLSIVNGWLLYRRHSSQFRSHNKDTMSLSEFRLAIAEVLLKPNIPKRPAQRGRPFLQRPLNKTTTSKNQRVAPVRPPPNSTRIDGFDHWPILTTESRCRYPGCHGFSIISCSKCGVRLCLSDRNNCFKDYHH